MRQVDLFESFSPTPQISTKPDPQDIRKRLNRMLGEARQASEMPWDARTARRYQTIFPQMADWLPAEEADALRAAFRKEIGRPTAAEAN